MTFPEKLRSVVGYQGPGLCVGLDPDPARMPPTFTPDVSGISAFLHEVIAASAPFARAYKVNTAFFEALGSPGWRLFEEIARALPQNSIRIADAKRGDIGNTARRYAEAFLKQLPFDAITLSPYLGGDSLEPFLADATRGAYVLALTTNPGSKDLQYSSDGKERLFERVLRQIAIWAPRGNLGAVVGATHPQELLDIRQAFPAVALLIPGVGAQGGDVEAIKALGYGREFAPVLINVSRGILYPDGKLEFPCSIEEACREYCRKLGFARRVSQ